MLLIKVNNKNKEVIISTRNDVDTRKYIKIEKLIKN